MGGQKRSFYGRWEARSVVCDSHFISGSWLAECETSGISDIRLPSIVVFCLRLLLARVILEAGEEHPLHEGHPGQAGTSHLFHLLVAAHRN
jgi:hypothetical protein